MPNPLLTPPLASKTECWGEIPVLVTYSPKPAQATILLAHGAGAPMDSGFMNQMSEQLALKGFNVARFEFPYMRQRRENGKKSPPNRMPVLLETWRQLLEAAQAHTQLPLIIAGKSMGGRTASMVLAAIEESVEGGQGQSEPWRKQVLGGVCLGYPFHPPSKPENTRVEHLQNVVKPLLILQGTRDGFGKPEEVAQYSLGQGVQVLWLESGDHDFKPLKRSGFSQADLIERAAKAVASWGKKALLPNQLAE